MEKVILANIIKNDYYSRSVMPFIKSEYFSSNEDKILFEVIKDYSDKYNQLPTNESLSIDLINVEGISEEQIENIEVIIKNLECDESTSNEWLIEQTETFCKDRSLYNAMMTAIDIVQEDGDTKNNISKTGIPDMLSEALGVSFDQHIGHDFVEQSDERYEELHKKEKKFRFDLEMLNKITQGGLPKKSMLLLLGGCVHPTTKVKIRIKRL